MKWMLIVALAVMSGCGNGEEAQVSRPEPQTTFIPEAAAAAPAPAPEPEEPEEPEKIEVWGGECYAGTSGTRLWSGKATAINMSEPAVFVDELTSKKVEIYGSYNCVWRFEIERVKRASE